MWGGCCCAVDAGHAAVRLTLDGKHLLHIADAVGHPLFMLHPDWRWPYDSDPQQAALTRRELLGWAAENQAIVFGSHLPFPALGRLTPEGEGWLWHPLET
jgi:glyoxylase-like metal-dependent hydrolase (beta-lactamase superfamily II)